MKPAGRSPDDPGNHRTRRRLSRGAGRRRLPRARKIRRQLAAGASLQARDERRDARTQISGMGARGEGVAGERRGGGVVFPGSHASARFPFVIPGSLALLAPRNDEGWGRGAD